jgi:hypothetical protein
LFAAFNKNKHNFFKAKAAETGEQMTKAETPLQVQRRAGATGRHATASGLRSSKALRT